MLPGPGGVVPDHHLVGPGFPDQSHAVGSPYDTGDTGSRHPGEPAGEEAYPAGGTGDQDVLPEQPAGLLQGVERREARHGQRRRLRERHPVRQDRQRARRHGDQLGPRAGFEQANHARALGRSGAVGRRALDGPGEVPSGAEPGLGRRLRPAHLAPVERDRRHPYQAL